MIKPGFVRIQFIYIILVICVYNVSCIDTKKALYFTDQKDSTFRSSNIAQAGLIQPNDLYSISITSPNPEASAMFNILNTSGTTTMTSTGAATNSNGYLVNSEGFIELPLLGSIKAAGLSKKDLTKNITQLLKDKELLLNPIVTIRQLNYKVTVLGEVAKPSVLAVPSEKISLLEALGLAGDLTIYAKRDNVLILREEGDQKIIKRINLNSTELINSPYYYLKSNDIVYVEPNKTKIASSGNSRLWIPIVASTVSLLIIVIDRVTR